MSRLRVRTEPEDGFTLMELLVAMTILTIVMAIGAWGLFAYWRAQALTGAANQVLTDMRDAQVRAQAEVRAYRLVFNLGSSSYEVQRIGASGDFETAEARRLDQTILIETASFSPTAGCLTDPDDPPPPPNIVYFCPRGVSSNGSVVIRSTRLNQDREIAVTGLTSRAEVR